MRWLHFLSFLIVGTWVYAEVFDLGDMIQYVVRLVSTPTPTSILQQRNNKEGMNAKKIECTG